ncbi:hypothetical protein GPECTOR_22g882 [Gonium pectorale]|uniref:Uncharacterized protein n=1 Tax=Gonium pectorale TaxID=33097 RepID=A0A150GHG8_GONPE|nr:hypothetical protein GPECTOR_22g882 [Gonium pectorale]|eukprot:KXZ49288.1 hypothetical protein GPECTOR_22g882 [Gonium pectorale]
MSERMALNNAGVLPTDPVMRKLFNSKDDIVDVLTEFEDLARAWREANDGKINATGDQKWALRNMHVPFDEATLTIQVAWDKLDKARLFIRHVHLKRLVLEFNLPFHEVATLTKDGGKKTLDRMLTLRDEDEATAAAAAAAGPSNPSQRMTRHAHGNPTIRDSDDDAGPDDGAAAAADAANAAQGAAVPTGNGSGGRRRNPRA